jgi:hypothetical protein
VAYIPLQVKQDEQSGEFHLEVDSHLYVNKRAVDYVAQELELPSAHQTLCAVEERIIYLDPGAAPAREIGRIFGKLQALFDLDRALTLEEGTLAAAQSSRVKLTTAAYLPSSIALTRRYLTTTRLCSAS